MSYHGIPFEGTVWQASARYNNKVLTRQEVDAWFEKARLQASQFPEDLNEDGPQRPDIHALPLQASEHDTIVYTPKEHPLKSDAIAGPSAQPEEQNLRPDEGSNFQRSQASANQTDLFVFGITSSRQQSQTSFTFSSSRHGAAQPNNFCDLCQFIISKARAFRPRPSEGAQGEPRIYIEGNGRETQTDEPLYSDVFAGYKTFSELYQSASDGCHLCSLLTSPDAKGSADPPRNSASQVLIGVYGDKSFDGPGRIEIQDSHQRYGRKVINLSFDQPHARIQGSLRHDRTDTDALFTLAKGWVGHCRTRHKLCHHRTGQIPMPTRVLKIESTNGMLDHVRLCQSSDEPSCNAPYLALSHCWGEQNIIQLVSKDLAALRRNIPISELLRNFRDAALITARLGFAYLWIDSLCIIQDSNEDKAREIPKMADIYGGAALTIAALGAKDSSVGCFVTRNPLELVPTLVRDGDAKTRDQVWVWNHKISGPSAEGSLRPPLHRRGWVVQERALSPRTLHFGFKMVYWECIEGSASEARPGMQERHIVVDSNDPALAHGAGVKTALQAIRLSTSRGGAWEEWEGFWWKIVKEYTASQLTRISDKWNAISALAVEVERCTQSRLYHGLWECNLFEEIMWQCSTPGKRNATGPSWSWLSIEGVIQVNRFDFAHNFSKLATVEKPAAARTASDGLGRSRELWIRGHLLQVFSELTDGSAGGYSRRSLRLCEDSIGAVSSARLVWRWSPDMNPRGDWDLAALPLVKSRLGDGETFGLVIRPSDASKLSWVRVGWFQLYWLDNKEDEALFNPQSEEETVILV
ncbi:hypothetical protein SCARD494_00197 [Seiridium cardinale]